MPFRNDQSMEVIKNVVAQRTTDRAVKLQCVKRLEEVGAKQYTLNKIQELDEKVREEIEKLGGNEELVKLMDSLKV